MVGRTGSETAKAAFHDERRHLVGFDARVRVEDRRLAENGEDVGDAAVGDPNLAAVEDVMSFFRVEDGARFDRGCVRTAA